MGSYVVRELAMQASHSENPGTAFHEDRAPDTVDNRELAIIAVAKDDPRAFEPLYRQYVGLVYHYALGRLRDPHRAEDATSQTFTRALQAPPGFKQERRPDSTTFRSWHRSWMSGGRNRNRPSESQF